MQFSENWLRTMVDPNMTSDELAHMLTMSGLEVEEVEAVAPPFSNVVVAKVLELAKHPNADRLTVCQVDAGNVVHASDPNGIVVITAMQPILVVFSLPQQALQKVAAAMPAFPKWQEFAVTLGALRPDR